MEPSRSRRPASPRLLLLLLLPLLLLLLLPPRSKGLPLPAEPSWSLSWSS